MKEIIKKISFAVLAFSITILSGVAAHAADGDLDPTFGANGIVTAPMGTANDTIQDIAIQPDGKIVAVGTATGTGGGFAVARFNTNGTFDTTFGTGGKVLSAPGSAGFNQANAVALQADGKIVVVGQASNGAGNIDFAIVRYNTNGTLDTTFDTDGVTLIPIGTLNETARAVKIQSDGKIVVAGNSQIGAAFDFALLRLKPDGSLDETFDTDGKVTTAIVETNNDLAYSVAIQADGKIVAAGATYALLLGDDFALARYNTDGSLDTTFDTDGIVTTQFGTSFDRANSVLIQPDGKILAGGGALVGTPGVINFGLARYNTNDSLDMTFGTAGKTTTLPNVSGQIQEMALQPNGKIVVAGSAGNGTTSDFGAARFTPNGTVDISFGNAGKVVTAVNATANDQAFAMRIQPDGKIVAAGESIVGANIDFALVRYNNVANNAFVDFDGDGKTDFGIIRRPGVIGAWTWWLYESGTGNTKVFNFGLSPNDIVQPLDYDGDGKDDIAMWRNTPQAGQVSAYYIIQSSDSTVRIIPFGQNGDTPTTADYDGDGKDDLSVWRAPSTAQGAGQAIWYYRGTLNNPNNNITYIPWGIRYGTQADQVDEAYPGDFDGDGRADFRVQRRADITVPGSNTPAIFYTLTAAGVVSYDYFGLAADRILPGDYDGDGKTDICVARGFNISPGNTTWYIRYSSGIPDYQKVFGFGFNFAQGDYDGDGTTDLGYFLVGATDEETGFWYIESSTGAAKFFRWGARPTGGAGSGDLPIAGYNNR